MGNFSDLFPDDLKSERDFLEHLPKIIELFEEINKEIFNDMGVISGIEKYDKLNMRNKENQVPAIWLSLNDNYFIAVSLGESGLINLKAGVGGMFTWMGYQHDYLRYSKNIHPTELIDGLRDCVKSLMDFGLKSALKSKLRKSFYLNHTKLEEHRGQVSNKYPELLVPLFEGGEISLADWDWKKKIPIYTELGIPLGNLEITEDSTPARLAVARTIQKSGSRVKIH